MNQSPAANSLNENSPPPEQPSRPVIFFDGVCGLCDRFVTFIITRDRHRRFLFAPLQGTTAQQLLHLPATGELNSVILWDSEKTFWKSAAVVRILWKLGGLWHLLGSILWLIPLPLRNLGYSVVAKSRYRLFGKKDVCRMPKPEERELFLD